MKGSKVVAVILAMGAVAAAGVVIRNWWTGEHIAREAMLPAALVAQSPVKPIVTAVHMPAVKPREFQPIGPASALALNAREPELTVQDSKCSLLLRELARQAVLIAARQGLGLPTRDCTLREGSRGAVLDDNAPAPGYKVLEIGSAAINGKSMKVWVSLAGPNGKFERIIDTQIALGGDPKSVVNYAAVIGPLERMSRGEFASALRNAGYAAATASKAGAEARDLRGIEKSLGVLSLVSQFSAVRQAHASIRSMGESPELLGALVRGYANLGQLTRFLWNASHKDFAARSLLYAERMVAASPGSADALRQRGYARAMAGLHALALTDLDEAERLDRGAGAPAWAPLIRDYCRYDTEALSDAVLNTPEQAPLASYLCFLTVERCQSESAMMGFGQVAMNFNPACLQVLDAMCDRAGVIAGHTLTLAGPAAVAQSLAKELPAIPGLPQSVRDTLPADARKWSDPNTSAQVARALVEAGQTDTAEPSWTVLGRMVQEAQFVQVWRRAAFLRDKLAVDASQFARACRPLVAEHPYAALFDSFAGPVSNKSIKGLEVVDAEKSELPLIECLGQVLRGRPGESVTADNGGFWTLAHEDDLAQEIDDWTRHVANTSDPGVPVPMFLALRADKVSPYMPAALAARIEEDWRRTAPRAAQIERDFGSQPDVGAALARQYHKLGKTTDLIRVLQRYLKVAPDYWAFEMLAQGYLDSGDESAWLATLEKSMQQEDYGLNHAEVNQRIALHFMDAGHYDRAEPYARAAAESGAEWAMRTAAECFEGLGKWDEAEEMVHDAASRYGRPADWYMWCMKTGHGHLDAASQAMSAFVATVPDPVGAGQGSSVAFYLLGQGRTDEAMARLRRVAGPANPWACLYVAMWCAANKDDKGCDKMLKLAQGRGRRTPAALLNHHGLVGLAGAFADCRAAGPSAKLDLAELDKAIADSGDFDPPGMLYFTAKFLELRDDEAGAQRYYARCLATRGNGESSRMLAGMELRKRGIDPTAARLAVPKSAPVARPAKS